MKFNRYVAAMLIGTALAACQPAAEWTESEAPKQLALDSVPSRIDLRFAPGSDRLLATDAKRLQDLVAAGAISRSDRVVVSAAGGPALAQARTAAVSSLLLKHDVVATSASLGTVPPNRAIVSVERTLVTLPRCPNWSKPSDVDFTNTPGSYFGCSTAVNLGRMIATPTDLASGRPQGLPEATPATAAVQRYLTDKVVLPSSSAATPFGASGSTSSTGGGAGTGSGGSGGGPGS
jgi:pilus assembly protein CpaD